MADNETINKCNSSRSVINKHYQDPSQITKDSFSKKYALNRYGEGEHEYLREGEIILCNDKENPGLYMMTEGADGEVINITNAEHIKMSTAYTESEESGDALKISSADTVNNAVAKLEKRIKNTGLPYSKLIKRHDFLYDIEYDNIDYDFAYEYFKNKYKIDNIAPGCSSVRSGNFFGRNFDWNYDKEVTFAIRLPRMDGRYASIGIAGCERGLTSDVVAARGYSELYKILPFKTLDGINEYGVFCNINVVPKGDKGKTTGTHEGEGKPDLCMMMIPRVVLDKHKTALDACNDIAQNYNIYAPSGEDPRLNHYEVHVMIGDETSTFIMEFIDNSCVVKPVGSGYNYEAAMTNFYIDGVVLNDDKKVYTPAEAPFASTKSHISDYGSGLERYNYLLMGIDGADTKETMSALMRSIWYSNAYNRARLEDNSFWFSEFVNDATTPKFTVATSPEVYCGPFTGTTITSDNYIEICIQLFEHKTRESGTAWITVHNSVYDIKNRILYLRTQECMDGFEDEYVYHLGEEGDTREIIDTVFESSAMTVSYNKDTAMLTLNYTNKDDSTVQISEIDVKEFALGEEIIEKVETEKRGNNVWLVITFRGGQKAEINISEIVQIKHIVLTEDEYEIKKEAGELEDGAFYYTYEDEI